jgi:hypothetical protein
MPKPGSLADGGVRVHLVRDAAITFRESGGPEEIADAERALLKLAIDAEPVERDADLEVWAVVDRERELAITLRVLRWRRHAVVMGVAVQADDAPRLRDPKPTAAALRAYCSDFGRTEAQALAELRVAAHDAKPVDVEVQPELWRYRSRLTDEDVSLRIQRTGDGPVLIVKAERSRARSR